MARSSFVRDASGALICLLLLVLIGLEAQRMRNEAACDQTPVTTPSR